MYKRNFFKNNQIISDNTKIREEIPIKEGKRVELEVDTPVQFLLYDKMDPTLRDIRNDVRKKKKRRPRTTIARIKRRKSAQNAKKNFKTHRTAVPVVKKTSSNFFISFYLKEIRQTFFFILSQIILVNLIFFK